MDKWQRTKKVIPLGVQTLSKQPNRYVEGVYPVYIEKASGCYVFDNKGKMYIDYPCALGAIILGYGNSYVDLRTGFQTASGILYSLPSHKETELAEKLVELIPCAEMVRFLKTGSEAVSASIKIARSYTRREHIASFGYHGWHDWCQVASKQDKGIPRCYKRLMHQFKYNDLDSLERILRKYPVAAVIMEPYVYDPPKQGYLKAVKRLTHKYGALLIFDEIITGFRTPGWSAQAYFNVIPDLATFSKGMANGYPMACVVGKRRYMKELEKDCFVSSTFGGDLVGITAALATIEYIERNKVIEHIWRMGTQFMNYFNYYTGVLSPVVSCIGYPCRTYFKFPTVEHKSLFWQECLKRSVLFGHAQFISYSHKEETIDKTIDVMVEALQIVVKHWKNPKSALEGKPAREGKRT